MLRFIAGTLLATSSIWTFAGPVMMQVKAEQEALKIGVGIRDEMQRLIPSRAAMYER